MLKLVTPAEVPALSGVECAGFEIEAVVCRSTEGGLVTRAYKLPREAVPYRVALTLVDPEPLGPDSEGLLERWKLARTLTHPSILHVIDCGRTSGLMYVATEWLEGHSLTEVGRRCSEARSPLSTRAIASIGCALAETLHHVHTAQDVEGNPLHLAHGRVWPGRVLLLKSGHVKVLGFAGPPDGLDLIQMRERTPEALAYAAPEQLDGAPADTRTDLYATALLLVSLCLGHNPLLRPTVEATREAIRTGAGLDEALRQLDPGLAVAVRRCLSADPDKRPRSAQWLVSRLSQSFARNLGPMQASDWRVLIGDLFGDDPSALPPAAPDTVELAERFWDALLNDEPITESDAGAVYDDDEAFAVPVPPPVPTPPAEPEQRRRYPLAWIGAGIVGLVLLLLLVLGGLSVALRTERTPEVADAAVTEVADLDAALTAYLDEVEDLLEDGNAAAARTLLTRAHERSTEDAALDIRRTRLDERTVSLELMADARRALVAGDLPTASDRAAALLERGPGDPATRALVAEIQAAQRAVELDEGADEGADEAGEPGAARTPVAARTPRSRPSAPVMGMLTITTSPPSVVYVDGALVGPTPVAGHEIGVGTHTLTARVAGHQPLERELLIEADTELALEVTLDATPSEPEPEPEVAPAAEPEPAVAVAEAVAAPPAPAPVAAPTYDHSVGSVLPARYALKSRAELDTAMAAVEAHVGKAGVAPEVYRGITDTLRSDLLDTYIPSVPLEIYARPMFEHILSELEAGRSRSSVSESLALAHKRGALRKAARGR